MLEFSLVMVVVVIINNNNNNNNSNNVKLSLSMPWKRTGIGKKVKFYRYRPEQALANPVG